MNEPEISIVLPIFDEAGSIEMLYQRLVVAAEKVGLEYEIVFVDDGSRDASWATITRLHQTDSRVRALRFTRNFGHQKALFAGICVARGNAIISLDADLQHPPELISELVAKWQQGFRVVNTVRIDSAKIGMRKRLMSRAFYKIFSVTTGSDLGPGMADYRLLDRAVVNELKRFHEPHLFLRGLVQWMGYPSTVVRFHGAPRSSGASKYSWRRMFRFAITGMTSFSVMPLRISILIGFITSALAFAELTYVLVIALVYEATVPGWASMTGIVSLLIGVLFVVLGVIGEYVGRIFETVRNRPAFLISESLDAGTSHGSPADNDER